MAKRFLLPVALAVVAATLVSGSALARGEALRAPSGLQPFLLRASEPVTHDFPRTPSFSWNPVRGASRYEFQLAKNITFTESSIFYTTRKLTGPAVAVPLSLPWMTGHPYAAYARVRGVTSSGVTTWSKPFGFNLRWKDIPKQLPGYPGLSRWTPVEGATGYEVWFTKIGPGWVKRVSTRTNAVDHREAYAFHDGSNWTSEVRWRVRAVRADQGVVHLNGLAAVWYGPWSPEYVSTNTPQSGAVRALVAVTNGAVSKAGDAREHELTPAFAFSGREAINNGLYGSYGLYRVYVATDSDCVNVVYKGAVVGSPAYAPRTSGPLQLPIDGEKEYPLVFDALLDDGAETSTFAAGLTPVVTTEQEAGDVEAEAPTDTTSKASTDPAKTTGPVSTKAVDLPESGWPNGRFYWTVVPIKVVFKVTNGKSVLEYHELMPAQDQCQSGNVVQFGKSSSPVLAAGSGTPYASGMTPDGRLVAASNGRARFYGHPLVAWSPVQGAAGYEVQWSLRRENWKARGSVETEGTSAILPLPPGKWYYRVRARNPYLPGVVKRMAWSSAQYVVVAKPRFIITAR